MTMIHNPATVAMGNTKDMEAAIAMLNEVKESILNAYVDKTGLSRNKLSKMMDDETWFIAKKAVELGFADKVLFDKEEEKKLYLYHIVGKMVRILEQCLKKCFLKFSKKNFYHRNLNMQMVIN